MMDPPVGLARLLDDACARHPDKLALACGDRRLSFAQVRELAARLATALVDAGLAGERVATLLPNGPELIVCYLGCWAAGVVMVPFEYVDAPREIRYGLADCGARWLIVHEEKLDDLARVGVAQTAIDTVFVVGAPREHARPFASLLDPPPRPCPEVPADTPAFILYTSGSTALPKGVIHSHASAAGIVASVLDALRRVDGESRIVAHDSVSHMGGWIEAFPFLWRGATVVLAQEFAVERFFADLRQWQPTIVGAHIDHLWQVVRRPGARRPHFASLDTVFTGGDELPIPLQRAFMELAGLPIEVGWGMTEAIWLTIARTPELRRRGFMGRPVQQVQLRLVGQSGTDVPDGEAGELWVKGPMVSPGYWNRPEANREVFVDGWLRTATWGCGMSTGATGSPGA